MTSGLGAKGTFGRRDIVAILSTVWKTLNEISRPDREAISQAPKHRDAHRRLRALDLTHVAGAEANPIREVLLSPPPRVREAAERSSRLSPSDRP